MEHMWLKSLFILCKWFHVIRDLRRFTTSGKRPGAHCTGVGVRPTDQSGRVRKISQSFRKSRRTSENTAELRKISQNFGKSRRTSENPAELRAFLTSTFFHVIFYPISTTFSVVKQTVSFDLRDFFRLPTKTQSSHYNTTKLPYILNRVRISVPDTSSQNLRPITI